MNQETEFRLKKSLIIHALAVTYILAPFGNLASELFMGGRKGWYNPIAWWELNSSLNVTDQVMLIAILVAGVALLVPRKTSWFLAIIVLCWVSVHNLFYFINHEGAIWSLRLVPALFNLPVLIILYHFRFPYLDKRDHIFHGMKRRSQVSLSGEIGEEKIEIQNLSLKGALITGSLSLQEGEVYQIKIGPKLSCSFEVVFVEEHGVGGAFKSLTKGQKTELKALLRTF